MPPPKANSRRAQFKRALAKRLRDSPTDAERKVWHLLRTKQLGGLKFRRQQPIGPYIVDFFCPAAKLIVEVDGDQHGADGKAAYDLARTQWLEARGYEVVRFPNGEALKGAILETIWHEAERRLPLPKQPDGRLTLPQGEGG